MGLFSKLLDKALALIPGGVVQLHFLLLHCYTIIQEDGEKKTPNEKKDKKKKATVRSIDLPVDSKTHSYSRDEINSMMEKEVSACWSRFHIWTLYLEPLV